VSSCSPRLIAEGDKKGGAAFDCSPASERENNKGVAKLSLTTLKRAQKRQSNPCIIRGYFALIVFLVKRSMLRLLCLSFGYAWALLPLLLPLRLRLLARLARLEARL